MMLKCVGIRLSNTFCFCCNILKSFAIIWYPGNKNHESMTKPLTFSHQTRTFHITEDHVISASVAKHVQIKEYKYV